MDPDLYLNPFFVQKEWFDHNPGTLRQFREWLQGAGPYAGHPAAGVPDLSHYRKEKPLPLTEVNALSGRQFKCWVEVNPPRSFPHILGKPFWEDGWVREWKYFRRHLVDLHYDELLQWLVEAGLDKDLSIRPRDLWHREWAACPLQ